MKVCVLGSGSSGNCIYVEAGATRALFDAGLSAREIKRRLLDRGLDPAGISAIVISHEHHDHIAGLRVLGKSLPVFASAGTAAALSTKFDFLAVETIEPGEWRRLGDLCFLPLSTSHDAAEPMGFVIEDGSSRMAVITDLGVVTRSITIRLADLDLAVIEANHDPDLLVNGPYPWEIKQRVKSRRGHLANPEAAELIKSILHPRLKQVLLAHLSETNNRPELAVAEVRKKVDGAGVKIQVCHQRQPAELIEF